MNQASERPLSLACVADQFSTAAVLHEALLALFPGATVRLVHTDVERHVPDDIDCAVIDASMNGPAGVDVLRRLRALGYDGAAVLVVDASIDGALPEQASVDRLGGHYCELSGDRITPLAKAVADALVVRGGMDSPASGLSMRALRQTQRLLAAGELAMRLQHSLNNPLAALLAEAQLLELEHLTPDHRESVGRIIELSRRVIDVVRGLDGIGRA